MWDIAPEYHAMLVFAEHRYYGESMPTSDYSHLSSEQALADFAVLVADLKEQYGDVPFVAFGGSYGGDLLCFHNFFSDNDYFVVDDWEI